MFPQEIFASEAIQSKMLDDIAIPKTLQVFYYMFSACDFLKNSVSLMHQSINQILFMCHLYT